jgi:hypothetical protein
MNFSWRNSRNFDLKEVEEYKLKVKRIILLVRYVLKEK